MGFITNIAEGIAKTFETTRTALLQIPPLFVYSGASLRPGLSAISLTAAIIQRLPEAGIETGVNNDGTENMVNKFVRIICEEVIKEIKDNAKITCEILPGAINSVGSGANGGGPIVIKSVNDMPVTALGIMQ